MDNLYFVTNVKRSSLDQTIYLKTSQYVDTVVHKQLNSYLKDKKNKRFNNCLILIGS